MGNRTTGESLLIKLSLKAFRALLYFPTFTDRTPPSLWFQSLLSLHFAICAMYPTNNRLQCVCLRGTRYASLSLLTSLNTSDDMNRTTSESPPCIKLAAETFLSLKKCTFTNKTLELSIQSFPLIHQQVG